LRRSTRARRSYHLFSRFPLNSFHLLTFNLSFNLHSNLNLQHHEEDAAGDEDEDEEDVPSSGQHESGSGRPRRLCVRGSAGFLLVPKTDTEKLCLEPTKRE
jgi:hypothetical protein